MYWEHANIHRCVTKIQFIFPAATMSQTIVRQTKHERVAENRARADVIRSKLLDHHDLLKVAVDCSFGGIMSEQEQSSLTVQLQECYSHLRKFGDGKCQMFMASVDSKLRATLDRKGAHNWAVHIHEEPIENLATQLGYNIIVMSPDASDELTYADIVDTRNLLVIGGIVDKVVSRNETAHKAIRIGAGSRRIPMNSGSLRNRILNIDTVFQFLVQCYVDTICDRQEMIDLILNILPTRKKASTKGKVDDNGNSAPERSTEAKTLCDPSNTVKLDRYNIMELFH